MIPLIDCLKGKNTGMVDRTPYTLESFSKIKFRFSKSPLLRHFDLVLPIRIEPDISAYAVGVVLLQLFEGRWYPVAFISYKLRGSELRYSTPEGELFIIIFMFKKWLYYLKYI